MNKQRRKELSTLADRVTALQELVAQLKEESEAIHGEIDMLREQEQDAFDNLSQGLQQAERGEQMEHAVSSLDDAMSALDDLNTELGNFNPDDIVSKIDEAMGMV